MIEGKAMKIPKGQILWQSFKNLDGQIVQIITSDQRQEKWFLYDVSNDGTLIKIETGKNPLFDKISFYKDKERK